MYEVGAVSGQLTAFSSRVSGVRHPTPVIGKYLRKFASICKICVDFLPGIRVIWDKALFSFLIPDHLPIIQTHYLPTLIYYKLKIQVVRARTLRREAVNTRIEQGFCSQLHTQIA